MDSGLNVVGYTNLGMLQKLMKLTPHNLSIYDRAVLTEIGNYSIGYCRPTTNVPDGLGHNRNASDWAKSIGISKTIFLRSIKYLQSINLLHVHEGSVYRADGGSYPNYYSIVFDKAFQTKHNLFFNVSGKSHTKPSQSAKPEPVLVELPDVSDYFIYGKHVYSVSNPDTAATRDTLISRNLFVYPTASELYKHLTKLNPTIKYINPEE